MSPLSRTVALVCGLSVALLASCGPPTPPDGPATTATAKPAPPPKVEEPKPFVKTTEELADYGLEHVGVSLPSEDICEKNEDGSLKNPIPEGAYEGLLRNAKCDQQKFITMARVAGALGVQCDHCHVKDPNDPKKEIYPEFTDNKRKANCMFKTFIQGLRPRDGSAMTCRACHYNPDDKSKGKPKVLQDPRDRGYAQEWMHEVMTTQFVEANGKRLKCKTCHVGLAPDTDGWIKDVVRRLRYKGEVERRDDLANDIGE